MPSSFSHAAVGFTVAYVALPRPKRTTGMLWAAACCAALPDLDNIGVLFGHPDLADYLGGHRGFTHSFFFAALLGLLVAYRAGALKGVVIAAATASHGLLDAFTTQGPGIAFLSPFSSAAFTAPWHPLDPSGSAAAHAGFAAKLAAVVGNELLWVGGPCAALILLAFIFRYTSSREPTPTG